MHLVRLAIVVAHVPNLIVVVTIVDALAIRLAPTRARVCVFGRALFLRPRAPVLLGAFAFGCQRITRRRLCQETHAAFPAAAFLLLATSFLGLAFANVFGR